MIWYNILPMLLFLVLAASFALMSRYVRGENLGGILGIMSMVLLGLATLWVFGLLLFGWRFSLYPQYGGVRF